MGSKIYKIAPYLPGKSIALAGSIKQGFVKTGDLVLLSGFAVGYSWGATIIKI